MQTDNDPSSAEDFTSQKKVITRNNSAPAGVSRHKIQASRLANDSILEVKEGECALEETKDST